MLPATPVSSAPRRSSRPARRAALLRRGADRRRPNRSFFAFEQLGVRPHLVTLAKGLRTVCRSARCSQPTAPRSASTRDHASTFGGNPSSARLRAPSSRPSTRSCSRMSGSAARTRRALPVRGAGLLLALETTRAAGEVLAPTASTPACSSPRPPDHAPSYSAPHRHPPRRPPRRSRSFRGFSVTAHRRERQGAILRLIREREISTQSSFVNALREPATRPCRPPSPRRHGARAGQGARRQRRLIYAPAGAADLDRLRALESAFRRWALSIDASDSLVVVFHPARFSAPLAEAIDESKHPSVLATVAGDNTIIVARPRASAPRLCATS